MNPANRIRTLVALLSAMVVVLLAPGASAQMKIAVVDLQHAMLYNEDGLRAQATLKKLFEKRQQELDNRQNQLKREQADLQKQAKVLSKQALQRRSEDLQRKMMELQTVYLQFNKELQKKQGEKTRPILVKVRRVLREIASQKGYDAILDRNAVPYSRSDLDITDLVIQRYNGVSSKGNTKNNASRKPSGKKH